MDIEKLRSDYQETKKQYKSLLLGEFWNRLKKTASKSVIFDKLVYVDDDCGGRYIQRIYIGTDDHIYYDWKTETDRLITCAILDWFPIERLFELYMKIFNKQ